jgi:hypothetical protein
MPPCTGRREPRASSVMSCLAFGARNLDLLLPVQRHDGGAVGGGCALCSEKALVTASANGSMPADRGQRLAETAD